MHSPGLQFTFAFQQRGQILLASLRIQVGVAEPGLDSGLLGFHRAHLGFGFRNGFLQRAQLFALGRRALAFFLAGVIPRGDVSALDLSVTRQDPALVTLEVIGVGFHPAVVHQQQLVHRIAQQVAVVADQDQGALVSLQRDLKGVTHIQVEVIGGLVQHQQVGALPYHHGQCQPGLLAAGKRCDDTGGGVAAKIEAPQEVENLLLARVGAEALQVQGRAGLQVQRFQLLLIEVADGAMLPGGTFPGQQGQVAHQAFQQGGFAGAVLAQQAVAAAGSQMQLDPGEDGRAAIAQAGAIQAQQWVAASGRGGKTEIKR